MPELELVDLDAPPRPLDPEYEAYLKRSERNQRYHCSQCFAFVSKEQALRCLHGYPGDEIWCPPGRGCNA